MLEEARRLRLLAAEYRVEASTADDMIRAQALRRAAMEHEWEANRIERSFLRRSLLHRAERD